MTGNLLRALRLHWAIALLGAAVLIVMLNGLGTDYLWSDEGDTAVLAANVLKFGVPKAWDGTTFTDSDRGARVNNQLVMVSHPWLQYYVTAASLGLVGENAFGARLPFALAGWLTVIVVYWLVYRETNDRAAAFGSAALLATSVQFLLYARQSRYYTLSALLSCLLIAVFVRMRSLKASAVFAAVAVLLFHTHPIGFAIIAALGGTTLLRSLVQQRLCFWSTLPFILLLTLPWLMLAPHGHAESAAPVRDVAQFVTRLIQFAIESTSVTPLLGASILLSFTFPRLAAGERRLLAIVFAALAAYTAATIATQSAQTLWYVGVRYTPAVIPLVAIASGILIVRVTRNRLLIWLALIAVFAFTKLPLLTPWVCWTHDIDPPRAGKPLGVHLPQQPLACVVGGGQLAFLRSLGVPNPGTVGRASEFLRSKAQPGDLFITNYGWDPLYFHTRLPQALKILPGWPVESAARAKNLPDYVFDVTGTRWVLWRPAWNGYLDYRGDQIERAIAERGGMVEQVARFDETVWENRENIHFHRFAYDEHLFTWPADSPPAQLFKVSWR